MINDSLKTDTLLLQRDLPSERKTMVIESDLDSNAYFGVASAFENTPTVKSKQNTYVYRPNEDITLLTFKSLLKSIKSNVFPMILMKSFLSLTDCNQKDLVMIYENIMERYQLKKTLLIISSMRVVDDAEARNRLLGLLKNSKFAKRKSFVDAVEKLKEYWK